VEVTLGRVEDIVGRRLRYDQETIEAKGYGAPGGQTYVAPQAARDVLRVKGHGLEPNEPGMTAAEKSLLAKRAGKLDALRNLSEQVNGVRISGETLVRDFVTRSDDIRSRVFSYIQGARVISEYQLADGSYEVEVEIDMEPLRRILGVR
jgi:outer membrane protein FlgP